jgi:hypothetical protein
LGDRKHQGFIIIAIWGRGVREGTAKERGQRSEFRGQEKLNSLLTQGAKGGEKGSGFGVQDGTENSRNSLSAAGRRRSLLKIEQP